MGSSGESREVLAVDAGIVERLSRDPLYQLSTAGQELFHSNMLYWLISEHDGAMSRLLQECFGLVRTLQTPEVAREKHHVDLLVDNGIGGGKLILENKLHSVPRRSQLEDYWAGVPSQFRQLDTKFALLSLIPPIFDLPEPWQHVDYDALIVPLREGGEVLRSRGLAFESDLVDRYADMIGGLVALRDKYALGAFDGGDGMKAFADADALLGPQENVALAEARLLPLVEKLRTSALVQLVGQETGDDDGITMGFSRARGIVEFSITGKSGHQFWWQYQNGQMRLAVVLDKSLGGPWRGRRGEREAKVEKDFADFFEFSHLDIGGVLRPYSGKLKWHGYEPDFVHQYRPVRRSATNGELAILCAAATKFVRSYAADH